MSISYCEYPGRSRPRTIKLCPEGSGFAIREWSENGGGCHVPAGSSFNDAYAMFERMLAWWSDRHDDVHLIRTGHGFTVTINGGA